MPSHAAFLRGMNVGGHRITNDELRDAFARIGFDDVGVYQASGNVAFDGARDDPAKKIEKGLEEELGYAVPTFVRTAAEMQALSGADPFDGAEGKVQVVFLRKPPPRSILERSTDTDRLALGPGSELFWLPAGGLMESELGMDGLADELGVCTHRTKGTVDRMTAKFFA